MESKLEIPTGYEELHEILQEARELLASPGGESALRAAFTQAAGGKGKERHAGARPFVEQPILEIPRLLEPGAGTTLGVGGAAFPLGQAMKKLQEHERLSWPRARAELLGAIVYLAAGIRFLREEHGDGQMSMVPTRVPQEAERLAEVPQTKGALRLIASAARKLGTDEQVDHLRRAIAGIADYVAEFDAAFDGPPEAR